MHGFETLRSRNLLHRGVPANVGCSAKVAGHSRYSSRQDGAVLEFRYFSLLDNGIDEKLTSPTNMKERQTPIMMLANLKPDGCSCWLPSLVSSIRICDGGDELGAASCSVATPSSWER